MIILFFESSVTNYLCHQLFLILSNDKNKDTFFFLLQIHEKKKKTFFKKIFWDFSSEEKDWQLP